MDVSPHVGLSYEAYEYHYFPIFLQEFQRILRRDRSLSDPWVQHLWWERLWTLQELLLAKHPVVYFGPFAMPWTRLIAVWPTYYERHSVSFTEWRKFFNLEQLRHQTSRDMHGLLLATAEKAFTEPKDRVLALIGALQHTSFPLHYALDLRVINALTAIHCIAEEDTFDILFSQWTRSY